ncbi:hypothetical protein FOCC_FOCC009370 [Frankliniella occidentalis]|uniref:Nucleic acid dioxygenase ALKBH1 n=1 Tax=Frankliniella occidentalis TaxID=133901 RepID=A0A6J1SJ84_FRAOC|nr:nucleic acid dioxygenase ALKBH1 [Frankliniella occidentalis]KAE8744004.1 hypothetical protein FOCC_FOCC009370 [Frankliniella occidentalis]
MDNSNKFRTDFKYYKQKCPLPDLNKVLDFSNIIAESAVQSIKAVEDEYVKIKSEEENFIASLMLPPSEWNIYELKDNPGLLFIRNPFTPIGQRFWIYRCLHDYTRKPNRLNIDAHNILDSSKNWWNISQREDQESLRKKLRWATLGYHHNWDTKAYSENAKDPFPSELAVLAKYVGRIVGCHNNFSAEAAIVNFYHFDSTLSGHTDHSEEDMSAPLFSFSFGQTAIFLLGGKSLEEAPTAMYIKSGDIVIMSKHSRECYHGIPKIVAAQEFPWNIFQNSNRPSANLGGQKSSEDCPYPPCKKTHTDSTENLNEKQTSIKQERKNLIDNILKEEFWSPFHRYIEQSRINMNVRQVLCKNHVGLST